MSQLEYWNIGKMGLGKMQYWRHGKIYLLIILKMDNFLWKPIIPSFHNSIIP